MTAAQMGADEKEQGAGKIPSLAERPSGVEERWEICSAANG